jgi:release factor glutamine methyltransferase
MTGREAWKKAARLLASAGRDDCTGSARRMLEEALGVSPAELVGVMDLPVDDDQAHGFFSMAGRAAVGEPLQYVIGRWDFYGRPFRCDRRALIPRPETELLVEAALKAMPPGEPFFVMDAGCGTGCIGISVKLERPQAIVSLCDVSAGALALSRENAELLGADVSILRADMRHPFPGGPYDVILSNPPYVAAHEMDALPREIREHEPVVALLGGEDGMEYIRALAERAADDLRSGGWMFVEVGCGQAGAAGELFAAAGLHVDTFPDYAGIPRVVAARKEI